MGYVYKLRTDRISGQDGEVHTVYGIELFEEGHCVQSVGDVFLDPEEADNFVSMCNRLQLSKVHLMDVIEDALIKKYML